MDFLKGALGTFNGIPVYEDKHLPKTRQKISYKSASPLENQTQNILFRLFCSPPKIKKIITEVEETDVYFINTDYFQGLVVRPEQSAIIMRAMS